MTHKEINYNIKWKETNSHSKFMTALSIPSPSELVMVQTQPHVHTHKQL